VRTYSTLSLDWVRAAIQAATDPTLDTVQFAFLDLGGIARRPTSTDWVTGGWEPDQLSTGEWVARCLIGPGGTITLTPAIWSVWIKITDHPTAPVLNPNTITVT
jgi:hypothetical protein